MATSRDCAPSAPSRIKTASCRSRTFSVSRLRASCRAPTSQLMRNPTARNTSRPTASLRSGPWGRDSHRYETAMPERRVASSPGQNPPSQALRRMAGQKVTSGSLAPKSGARTARSATAKAVAPMATA